MQFFRNNPLIILCVLLTFSSWLGYIIYVDAETLRSDQFPLILEYDRLVSGKYSFQELWQPKGGHRFPGYKLGFFLNSYLFGFSPIAETIVALFTYAAGVLIIILVFCKNQSRNIVLLLALFVLFLLCNSQTGRLSTYSLIAMRMMDFVGFLLLALYSFKILRRPNLKGFIFSLALYFLLACVAILLFGRGWGMAALASIFGLIVLDGIIQTLKLRKFALSKHFVLFAVLTTIIAIYFFGFEQRNAVGKEFNIASFLKYYVVKLGNANVGMFSADLASNVLLNNIVGGLYILATAAISLKLLIRREMDLENWTALFLIYFSLAATILVAISRMDGSAFFPRHNFELSLGLAGFAYFVFSAIKSDNTDTSFTKVSGFAIGIAIFLNVMLLSNFLKMIDNARYQRNFHTRLENNYLDNKVREEFVQKDFRKIECRMSINNCVKVLELMDKYGISDQIEREELSSRKSRKRNR